MSVKYLVSACLLGKKVKYNGESNYDERFDYFQDKGLVAPICPEVLGGLPIPRSPSEIMINTVLNKDNIDVTENYIQGASKTYQVCMDFGVNKVVLKERSPSCGVHQIYDGSFTNTVVKGSGITTRFLQENDINVYSNEEIFKYDAIVVAAGKSERTHLKYNKIFENCLNRSCIQAACEKFLIDIMCNKVIIVANKSDIPVLSILFNTNRVEIVEGGEFREKSVYNGLKKATSKYVLIHDGARPYVSEKLINNIVEKLEPNCAIVPYIDNGSEYDYKFNNKFIQTPQAYDKDLLLSYMDKIADFSLYRDESSILNSHVKINYIEGEKENKKITDVKDIVEWRSFRYDSEL